MLLQPATINIFINIELLQMTSNSYEHLVNQTMNGNPLCLYGFATQFRNDSLVYSKGRDPRIVFFYFMFPP